ncbi:MAG: L-aspartate oxidase [Elusimicrobiota bacterium]|jgi:L-aspartate oxidase|nr:L-aspartate oxidase [Elusimicrobiota bacterium]
MKQSDYLIIGSGIAGLSLAIKAAQNSSVVLITKRTLDDCNTAKAQGGIACVSDEKDSFESHIKDTLTAGAGLCNENMVEKMVKEAPQRVKELLDWGVQFSKDEKTSSGYALGLEAAHSNRRIFHSGDMTGKEIERALIEKVRSNKDIEIFEERSAIDLIVNEEGKCVGVFVLDNAVNKVEVFAAKIIVLACGGAGKTYLYTTNPDISTGDAIAMAYRAGADIANMEFVQFHPTCLYNKVEKSFLISEAIRGESGILRLQNGEPFMKKYHPLKELASRDIISRAIDKELKNSGDEFIYLDITHKNSDFLINRFPGIYAKCKEYGIDITKDMIPVVPAAHFLCGGIKIDENGRATIKNLYAIGECACSGIHGANRLASNSLLEGLVYAHRVFEDVQSHCGQDPQSNSLSDIMGQACNDALKPFLENRNSVSQNKSDYFMKDWKAIRHLSWDYLGITRTNEGLSIALKKIEAIKREIDDNFTQTDLSVDALELRNIAAIAQLIAQSAISRKESRGAHYNADYPNILAQAQDTVIRKR